MSTASTARPGFACAGMAEVSRTLRLVPAGTSALPSAAAPPPRSRTVIARIMIRPPSTPSRGRKLRLQRGDGLHGAGLQERTRAVQVAEQLVEVVLVPDLRGQEQGLAPYRIRPRVVRGRLACERTQGLVVLQVHLQERVQDERRQAGARLRGRAVTLQREERVLHLAAQGGDAVGTAVRAGGAVPRDLVSQPIEVRREVAVVQVADGRR